MNIVAIDGRHSSTVEETGYRGTAGQLRSKGPRWLAGARAFARRGGEGEEKATIWIAVTIHSHIGRGRSPSRGRGRKRGERACTVNTHARRYIHTAASGGANGAGCVRFHLYRPFNGSDAVQCCDTVVGHALSHGIFTVITVRITRAQTEGKESGGLSPPLNHPSVRPLPDYGGEPRNFRAVASLNKRRTAQPRHDSGDNEWVMSAIQVFKVYSRVYWLRIASIVSAIVRRLFFAFNPATERAFAKPSRTECIVRRALSPSASCHNQLPLY